MKRALNLLAEILTLPFSELFLHEDLIWKCTGKALLEKNELKRNRIHNFQQALENAVAPTAEYVNRHTEVRSLSDIKGYLKYVFRAGDILECEEEENLEPGYPTVLRYYIRLLECISESFLTTRNGKLALRTWTALPKSFFQTIGEPTQRIESSEDYFSPQRLELWNSLLGCLPENLFVTSFLAKQLRTNSEGAQRQMLIQLLHNCGETVEISDSLLDRILENGMAETHIHANASKNFGQIWENMLHDNLRSVPILEQESYHIPYHNSFGERDAEELATEANMVRFVLAAYIGTADVYSDKVSLSTFLESEGLVESSPRSFRRGLAQLTKGEEPDRLLSADITMSGDFIHFLKGSDVHDLWDVLMLPGKMKRSCPTLAENYLLCCALLYTWRQPEDTEFLALLLYYIRLKSKAYRNRVQDNKSKGLDYFQRYYDASTDKGTRSNEDQLYEILYNALRDRRVCKTELRFAPPKIASEMMQNAVKESESRIGEAILLFAKVHLYTLALMYGELPEEENLSEVFDSIWNDAVDRILHNERNVLMKILRDHLGVSLEAVVPQRLGIIFHLIKSGEKKEKSSCFIRKKSAVLYDLERYEQFSLGNARFGYQATATAISNLRDKCPAMSQLLVGMDAASLEIPTEPWVFAPAFRDIRYRNGQLVGAGIPAEKKHLIGITYHVGEDFLHPISGLRHMDEAIHGLGMCAGDRIGHGLVLGINLKSWFREHRMLVLPRIEMLENWLWAWNAITREPELNELARYLELIKRQITELARDIFTTTKGGLTIENLLSAYTSKMLLVDKLRQIGDKCRFFCKDGQFCLMESESFEERKNIPDWTEESLAMSYHCSYFKEKMQEGILITPSAMDLEIASGLQQYLRQTVAKSGLVIEANPSSNAVIGDVEGVLNHPVFEFRKGTPQVMVTLNTDDPSVFHASLANEYGDIYFAMRHNGMMVETALKEVDMIRETGLRTSFLSPLSNIEQLLSEYEEIISVLA